MTEEELQRLEWQIENYGCIFGRDALKLIAIVREKLLEMYDFQTEG